MAPPVVHSCSHKLSTLSTGLSTSTTKLSTEQMNSSNAPHPLAPPVGELRLSKKLQARERPKTLPPGGSCHWAAPKSRPMTEEECGRKFWSTEMLGLAGCFINIQPYFRPISCTNFQITARIPLPTRLFRTSFGRATLPPGEGISLRRDFFDKLGSPCGGAVMRQHD